MFLVVSTVSMLGLLALNIERFVHFKKDFYNLTISNNDSRFHCTDWHCTTDYVFSLLLIINLSKYYIGFQYLIDSTSSLV